MSSDHAGYQPPQIPDFPESLADLKRTLVPYAKEDRPIELFFEFFVVDVLEALPAATSKAVSEFAAQFPTAFNSAPDWRAGVKEALNLSQTIEVAILDLWYINRKKAVLDGWSYHPWHYAMNFVEKYFEEGSKVDVWEGDALELAKSRIALERRIN